LLNGNKNSWQRFFLLFTSFHCPQLFYCPSLPYHCSAVPASGNSSAKIQGNNIFAWKCSSGYAFFSGTGVFVPISDLNGIVDYSQFSTHFKLVPGEIPDFDWRKQQVRPCVSSDLSLTSAPLRRCNLQWACKRGWFTCV